MADSGQSQAQKKDPRAELDNLQKKFDSLIQKRNELNDLARQLRNERDMLHDGRNTVRERMDAAKKARDELNDKMREAKKKRNELQAQAKALIASRKGKAGDASKSLPLQARQLEKQIRDLELKQQTQPHSIEDERELLKIIKAKGAELKEIQGKLAESQELKVDLDNLDSAIDDLFKQADEMHNEVQALYQESSKHHDVFVECLEEVRVTQKEANVKHKAYIDTREKANEVHGKAMEMREEMIGLRGERRAEYEARKKELRDYNQGVRSAVADPERLKEKAEDDLSALKKGGKISLGV